jgi:hypothetical protein
VDKFCEVLLALWIWKMAALYLRDKSRERVAFKNVANHLVPLCEHPRIARAVLNLKSRACEKPSNPERHHAGTVMAPKE